MTLIFERGQPVSFRRFADERASTHPNFPGRLESGELRSAVADLEFVQGEVVLEGVLRHEPLLVLSCVSQRIDRSAKLSKFPLPGFSQR